MTTNGTQVLYKSGEVLYECRSGRIWTWTLPTNRQFLWENGVLYVWTGCTWCPLCRTPDWQSGIQFSCGFEAGRTLLWIGAKGEV